MAQQKILEKISKYIYESSFRKNLQNWILSFGTRDMIFKATVMQLASLSGNFKMNCMSCLFNELSPLTPRVRLRQRSRVWGVTPSLSHYNFPILKDTK